MPETQPSEAQPSETGPSETGSASEVESALRSRYLIRALVSRGLREVVYCPGSRDAPLGYALAAAEQAGWLRVHVRLDERTAGFMALGLSRAAVLQGRRAPAAVVTTSGTAVANLHPAVLEADAAGVPLLLLTADRPHEMWHTRANQTTVQEGIFGSATRFSATLPAGYPADSRLDGLVGRTMAAATGEFSADPGPVHLDVCFRDPLVPDRAWLPGQPPEVSTPARRVEPVGPLVEMPARSVVVAGDAAGGRARELSEEHGWPLLAEPSSGARSGRTALVDYQGLLSTSLADDIEGILVLGHPTLSRPVSRLLARTDIPITVITDSPRWTDVAGVARPVAAPGQIRTKGEDGSWLDRWHSADQSADHLADHPDGGTTGGSAGSPPDGSVDGASGAAAEKNRAAAMIWQASCTPGGPALMIGASAVIRSFDRHAVPGAVAPTAVANRGLAGIDGTVSTAVGLSTGLGRPVRAVVGDLTAVHDATGLLTGRRERRADVQVIVLNDSGGAIFAGLEHARAPHDVLERFFLTPQRIDLAHLAAALGADFQRVDVDGLPAVLERPVTGRGIVEVTLLTGLS